MHLGLVIYGSLDTLSGGYLYDRQLVRHLRQCGDQVEVISIPWRNYAVHLADNVSPAFVRRLRGGNYDALLQDELNHPSLFLANRRAGALREAPPISIVHHLRSSELRPAWQNAFYRWIEKAYLASVQGFIFNSLTTQASVQQLVGLQQSSIVAYPGGDRLGLPLTPGQIRARAAHTGPLKLLFVGNVIPRKGLDTLLEALAQIEGGWELNIVGSLRADRAYAAHIQERVARQFPASIKLLGALDDLLVTNYYLLSDLLAVPSSYEGYGIVYLEGMAAGLPALATTAGAANEIITSGQNGYLIPPGDSLALAEHLRRLIHDRPLLLQLSLAARERFLVQPSWEASMARIRKFILKFH